MRGDLRASEYTRCLARKIYRSEITGVRQRPLFSLFLSFLVFLVDGSSVSSFGYQLSALHGARLRATYLLFSFPSNTFFSSRHILSENEGSKINPRLIVACHGLRILSFICTTWFWDDIFTILLHDIDQFINPWSLMSLCHITFVTLVFVIFFSSIFEYYLYF